MDKWTELRTAHQVAKLGTVSAAAEALGLHRATINRHVDVLEAELGARIFIRHSRGYALTDFGEEVLKVADKAEVMLAELSGRARATDASLDGEIVISVLPGVSRLLMAPVAAFRKKHPGCRVNILATEALTRLEFGEAHIALRAGKPPEHPDYVVQNYCEMEVNLFASEDYLARRGTPKSVDELADHDFVGMPERLNRVEFIAWFAQNVSADQISVTGSDILVLAQLVREGFGIGILMGDLAEGHQGLQRVLPDKLHWSAQISLLTHVDQHRSAKVQEMMRFLKAAR